ncbi:MAG: hypothetical protein ACREN6_01915 [Gemmatimonadaceae bacterium]
MTKRRYGDDEVRKIFELATTGGSQSRPLPPESGGMTLDELQRIGEEAGIESARVAQAAASLDARGTAAPARTSFGMPVGVSRVVELPRAPTDREWEQLVSECRTAFGVKGKAAGSGGLREWSHGNLHVCVEATARGEQLRLSTLKEDAIGLNGLGAVMGGMAVLSSAIVAASGKPDKAWIVFGMFGAMSLAAFGSNWIRLPRWAREREGQMEAIAERAVKLLSNP